MTATLETPSADRPRKSGRFDMAPECRERLALLALVSPAILVIGALLIVPLAWLFAISLLDEGGRFTLHNYAMIFSDRSYIDSFVLTLWMSLLVTIFCVIAGFIVSYALTLMPSKLAALCLALIALPFWTSVLVRTYAWLVLLQHRGVVNTTLLKLGVVSEPLYLTQNRIGVLIGMAHIMLPFMVFPLYATLKRIDPDHMKAALALGSSPTYAFWHVYFPQTIVGLASGCILVFVMSLGFYITPALLGGGKTFVIAMTIERDVNVNTSWGPASAVGISFVVGVVILFGLMSRYVSMDRIFVRE